MPFDFPKCRWHHKKRAAHAVFLGEAYAKNFFEDFEQPNYQGSAFTWAGFPAMVRRLARATAPLEFPGTVEDRYYELTADTAYAKALELTQTRGYL